MQSKLGMGLGRNFAAQGQFGPNSFGPAQSLGRFWNLIFGLGLGLDFLALGWAGPWARWKINVGPNLGHFHPRFRQFLSFFLNQRTCIIITLMRSIIEIRTIQFWEFCQFEKSEIRKFVLNCIIWAIIGPFRTTCLAQHFLGLGLGQKNSAQGRFGPASFEPPLGLGQTWAKLVYRPGPIWAGPGQAQTHPYFWQCGKLM